MSRRKIREQIFKMLFRVEFYSEKEYEEQMNLFIEENEPIEKPDERYIEDKFNKIIAVLEEIDKIINESSKGWKTTRMGKVDLTLIRLAVYEIKYEEDIPTGVAINEAVELAKKYGLSDKSRVGDWLKSYNGHRKVKRHSAARGALYMTKGKKTTQQKRAEIVAFCLEHGRDYLLTVEHYGVSYQQIYAWVRKYEEKGIDGLADGRGRTRPESEMTEVEKLRVQNKLLQAQIKDKEMEIALLKKLKELERWDV